MDDRIETRAPRSAEVAHGLATAIHEQRLQPGTKLSEDEVGEIYGVSRTIVRAALQALAHDHLVVMMRNRGAFVAEPTVCDAQEVFEARALLEPRTARSAAKRATQEDVLRLRSHINDEHTAMAAGDVGRALRLSGQFHVEIARIADQETIAGFIETLVARSSLIIAVYTRRERALCESHAHDALIDALADGDEARAERLMTSHLADLLSALDLSPRRAEQRSLRDSILGAA